MDTYWHYTPGIAAATAGIGIKGILDARLIRPSTTDLGRKERPVVWFSSNQKFEPTAAEIALKTASGATFRADNVEDQAIQAGGLYRFGLPPHRLLPYLASFRELGISPDRRKRLARIAKRFGSTVREWWIHLDPVELDDPDLQFGYWYERGWHTAEVANASSILASCTEAFLPLYEKRLALISRF